VEVAAGPEGIRRQLAGAVPELLSARGIERSDVRGLGVGFGGPTDDERQRVLRSHQVAGWDDYPLADWLQDGVGVPAVLGHDADVAGLAEALHGAGKGLSPVFYVTLGSGIGGGLIVEGEVYRGAGRGAAEVGHLRLPTEEGMRPLEQLASGWAIGERASRLMGRPVSAGDVAELARTGGAVAQGVLEGAWTQLAEALCSVIALLCPRRIVIGGGVSLMGEELLFAPLRRRVAERVFAPFAGLTEVVPAALGEEVVVHGAIALARRRFG